MTSKYILIEICERDMRVDGYFVNFPACYNRMLDTFYTHHTDLGFSKKEVDDQMDNDCFIGEMECSSNMGNVNYDLHIIKIE